MQEIFRRSNSSVTEDPSQRIIIGVAGGSAAGKTTLCQNITRHMAFDRNFKVQIIGLDCFYKEIDLSTTDPKDVNWDHPSVLDFDLALATLKKMKQSNQKVPIPRYSFVLNKRLQQCDYVMPANIILFQGLMAFYDPRIRNQLTYKIFINCDNDIRLCRRLKRDTKERGRSIENILEQYNRFVKPAYKDFIQPLSVFADITIPGFRSNRVSVDFVVQQIKSLAKKINFKQKVSKTKLFYFGETDYYDMDYIAGDSLNVGVHDTFVVFPTSEEYQKQIEFFVGIILSQLFSIQYFQQIFFKQFSRIILLLFEQLLIFKRLERSTVLLTSIEHSHRLATYSVSSKGKNKVFLVPIIKENEHQRIFQIIKQNDSDLIVLLNFFCDQKFPKHLYRSGLQGVILVNLVIVCNQKRFYDAFQNNLQTNADLQSLCNSQFADQAIRVIAQETKISVIDSIALFTDNYELQLKKQQRKMKTKRIPEGEEIGIFKQYGVYSQELENLCGFHALHNLLCLENKMSLINRMDFIKSYMSFSKMLGRENYEPLERDQLDDLLIRHPAFREVNIAPLYYSFGYIQNDSSSLAKIHQLFQRLLAGDISYVYIVAGIYDHFILLKVKLQSVEIYDSNNISIRCVLKETENQEIEEGQKQSYLKRKKNMRELYQIIGQLVNGKSIWAIRVQLRIRQLFESFQLVKGNPSQINYWLKNEYPPQVIKSDLIRPVEELGKEKLRQDFLQMYQGLLQDLSTAIGQSNL